MTRLWLPHVLREIADKFGQGTALDFAKEHGGKILELPKKASPDHPIARQFGMDFWTWFLTKWSHGKLPIPKGPHSSHAQLRQTIRELSLSGVSAATVTNLAGCTVRTVHRYRERQRNAEPLPLLEMMGDKKK